MIHIFVLLLVISLALSVGVIFLIVQLNRRHPSLMLCFYLGVLVCLGMSIFSDLFSVYIDLVDLQPVRLKASLDMVCSYTYYLTMGGLFYTLPQFSLLLLGKPVRRTTKIILAVFALFFPAGTLGYYSLGYEIFGDIANGILILMLLSTVICLFLGRAKVENDHFQKIAKTIAILFAVFLPFFFLDMFFDTPINNTKDLLYDSSVFLLLFDVAWNGVNAVYLVRQFNLAFETHGAKNPRQRMEKFQLSKREQEIAQLIAGGASSKEIGQTLTISTMTVKNHIYNIYKKTGASSRVELLNILNPASPDE